MAPRRSSAGGRRAAAAAAAPPPPPAAWRRAALAAVLAPHPAKRWTELFFLAYSPVWITALLGVIVPFKLYDRMGPWAYMAVGAGMAAPCALGPWLLGAEAGVPLRRRYWVRANAWIAVFSFIGNYFWTHYFYRLLGAAYTFKAHRLNDVPIALFLMTHAYFCLYHALGNMAIRGARAAVGGARAGGASRAAAEAAAVFALAYATAWGETATIAAFPYYTFVDRGRMYTVGSLFYAIYFFVSFPAFFRMDEAPRGPRGTLRGAARDALAAGMAVTCLLDFWRLGLGGIVDVGGGGKGGLPWLQ